MMFARRFQVSQAQNRKNAKSQKRKGGKAQMRIRAMRGDGQFIKGGERQDVVID
jgi:hypothetical protein